MSGGDIAAIICVLLSAYLAIVRSDFSAGTWFLAAAILFRQ
jgi:hypothetical protein